MVLQHTSLWCREAAIIALHLVKCPSEREFRSLFGGPSVALHLLYLRVLHLRHLPKWWGLSVFLLTIHWLKNPHKSINSFCLISHISKPTLLRNLNFTLQLIIDILPSLSLQDRYDNWRFPVPCGVIDTATFIVQQPHFQSWQYLVGRNTYGVKYELICAIGVPRFISCKGPFVGCASDASIPVQSGTLRSFSNREALLADKIYKGNRILFLSPLPGNYFNLDQEEKAYNFLIYRARQAIERMISRLTVFGALCIVWRFSFTFHSLVVNVCVKLVNFFLLFEPLG